MKIAILTLLICATLVSRVSAQISKPTFSIHAGAGLHVLGFGVSSGGQSWRHTMKPTYGIGAALESVQADSDWGGRLDLEVLPSVRFDEDPTGSRLFGDGSGEFYWLILSAVLRAESLCASICAAPSMGVGAARYKTTQSEVRGHIGDVLIPTQITPALRIGVELTIDSVFRRGSVIVADYIGRPNTGFSNDVSALHVVIVAFELRL